MICSSAANNYDDDGSHGGEPALPVDQQIGSNTTRSNHVSLLIDATYVPADIRHSIDLLLLNEARELTEALIDAIHTQIRDASGHMPRTHSKQARQQFLALSKMKQPRIQTIPKAIKQQLGHLWRILASLDALIACGASLLAVARYDYQKLLVVSELVRQQCLLHQSRGRRIPDRIVRLGQAHIRPFVHGNARCNVEFGAQSSISMTGEGFTFCPDSALFPTMKE